MVSDFEIRVNRFSGEFDVRTDEGRLGLQSFPKVIARKTARSRAFLLVPPWSLLERLSENSVLGRLAIRAVEPL